ncbi:hypothetical protein K440DRAFT_641268 [Wilcoxina mikolae CBS 423.85]|nr:hypothetical protein K440DRAFT_641268 [Wilcoxina mikolae CBS 423.85]
MSLLDLNQKQFVTYFKSFLFQTFLQENGLTQEQQRAAFQAFLQLPASVLTPATITPTNPLLLPASVSPSAVSPSAVSYSAVFPPHPTPKEKPSTNPPKALSKPTSTQSVEGYKRVPLYKDKPRLCKLLGIDENDTYAMRDIRDWVKTECMLRGKDLDVPYGSRSKKDIFDLVTAVTNKRNQELGDGKVVGEEVIDALIHRISLDNALENRASSDDNKT